MQPESSQSSEAAGPRVWNYATSRQWDVGPPRVLGIINVTPDSFSDGGRFDSLSSVVAASVRAIADGADGLDIGGESTRPGAQRVEDAEQIRRVVPAIGAIRREVGDAALLTIDTTRAGVARAALDAGADAINDVSGGGDDEAMLPLAAERRCGIVLMHRLKTPERDVYSHQYASEPEYAGGVVARVRSELAALAARAESVGVHPASIVLDPGLGFGKSVEQNLELIEGTREIVTLGFPVLSGISRKSFTAAAGGIAMDRPASERVHASVALSVRHMRAGARIFRVHDVPEHVAALRAAWAAGLHRG